MAALALTLQYASFAIMVPIGLSQAIVQRVAIHSPGKIVDHGSIARIVRASLLVALLYVVVVAFFQIVIDVNFAALMVFDADIDAAITAMLDDNEPFALLVITVHALIIIMAGILRGLGEVNASLLIVLFCYWGGGIGLAHIAIDILDYGAGFGLKAIVIALSLSFISIALKLNSCLASRRAGLQNPVHECT
jgi:Na+-driven multidrug efflux pump